MECLEPRQLLAGQVTAKYVGNDMVIVGDNQANWITVLQTGPNQFAIRGDRDAEGLPTKVNGLDFWPFTLNGNLRISLDGGNDGLKLDHIQVAKDIIIDMGAGDDTFDDYPSFEPTPVLVSAQNFILTMGDGVDVAGLANFLVDNLYANFGSGSDVLFMQKNHVRKDITIDLGSGDDSIFGSGPEDQFARNLTILGGDGNDFIRWSDIQVAGDILIDMGLGNDQFNSNIGQPSGFLVSARNFSLTMGDGDDGAYLGEVLVDNLFASFGFGRDSVRFGNVHATKDITIDLGSGDDALIGDFGLGNIARNLTILAGDGRDLIETSDVPNETLYVVRPMVGTSSLAVEALTAILGPGDDIFSLGNVVTRRSFVVDGGPGLDRLGFGQVNRTPVVTGIEYEFTRNEVIDELHFTLPIGQSQQLTKTKQQNFVTDFQVGLDARGRATVTPISTPFTTGLIATAAVQSISADQKFIDVSVDLSYTLVDELWQQSVPLSGGPRTVQQPVVKTLNLATTVSVPDGGTVLAGDQGLDRQPELRARDPINRRPSAGTTSVSANLTATVTPRILRDASGQPTAVDLIVQVNHTKEKGVPRPNNASQAADARLGQLESLKITLHDGDTRTIARRSVQPLVTGVDVTTDRSGRVTVDPVVTQVETSLSATIKAQVTADRRYVDLDFDVLSRELVDLPTYGVFSPLGTAQIQLPKIAETSIRTLVQVPDGGTIGLGSVTDSAGKERIIVATPRIIIFNEEEGTPEATQAEPALQVTVELQFVPLDSLGDIYTGWGESYGRLPGAVRINAVDRTQSQIRETIWESFVTDFATIPLAGGGRTVRPVVAVFQYGSELTNVPTVSADLTSVGLRLAFRQIQLAQIAQVVVRTPYGMQTIKRPTFTTIETSVATNIVDGDTVETAPRLDSRGQPYRLRLKPRILGIDDLPLARLQAALEVSVAR